MLEAKLQVSTIFHLTPWDWRSLLLSWTTDQNSFLLVEILQFFYLRAHSHGSAQQIDLQVGAGAGHAIQHPRTPVTVILTGKIMYDQCHEKQNTSLVLGLRSSQPCLAFLSEQEPVCWFIFKGNRHNNSWSLFSMFFIVIKWVNFISIYIVLLAVRDIKGETWDKSGCLGPSVCVHPPWLYWLSSSRRWVAACYKQSPVVVELRSRSRSGEGQVRVRWGSGRSKSV